MTSHKQLATCCFARDNSGKLTESFNFKVFISVTALYRIEAVLFNISYF